MEPITLVALITSIASIIISITKRITYSECTKNSMDIELNNNMPIHKL